MPELPDVEIYKRYMDEHAIGRTVLAVHAPAPEILEDMIPQALGRRLDGHRLHTSHRHGKYLFVGCDTGDWLLMHFGMTGRLASFRYPDEAPDHTDLTLALDDGTFLGYVATRKLGFVRMVDDPEEFVAGQGLGPDAMALAPDQFRGLAEARGGSVKCWLMNQGIMAGLGNVYSDEVLFHARVHPKTAIADLREDGIGRVYEALHEVMDAAIEAGARPERMPDDFLLPHREDGARCPRCGGTVERINACGRRGYYCPGCQGAEP